MLFDELVVGVDLRIFFRSDEQHVLDEVRQSGMGVRVVVAAPCHADGGGGPVAVGRVDKQGAQLVGQFDVAVFAIVVRALDRPLLLPGEGLTSGETGNGQNGDECPA